MSETKCHKCLLREAFPADYEKYVASVLAAVPDREKAQPQLLAARLEACKNCDRLNNGTCMGCGCLVEIRAAMRAQKCPFGRWPERTK